jgi:transposase
MPREVSKLSWESIRRSRRWSVAEGRWVLAKLRHSGLSAKRFAELHQVSLTRVYQWCSRLQGSGKKPGAAASAAPRLVEVELPVARGRTSSADRVEIELLSGRRLSVPQELGLERLSALVVLLERR